MSASPAESARRAKANALRHVPDEHPLTFWIDSHAEGWDQHDWIACSGWSLGDWMAYRNIIDEYGVLWPEVNGQSAQVIVLRYLQYSAPKVRRGGRLPFAMRNEEGRPKDNAPSVAGRMMLMGCRRRLIALRRTMPRPTKSMMPQSLRKFR